MPSIVNAHLALIALRKVGYKSAATAISELVDNAIEAKAKDIDIISLSDNVVGPNRSSLNVLKIAVLDNGEGMPLDTLQNCLSLGWGTRLDGTSGSLGRFGFGLKGSSISQGRRVEVYSWQNMDWNNTNPEDAKVNMSSLDLDTILENNQSELDEVVQIKMPAEIAGRFGFKIKKSPSGTLVVWSKLDQIGFKKVIALTNSLNEELCKLYRFYLSNGDFGKKRNIFIQDVNLNTGVTNPIELVPNDPMYLMAPNNLVGYENEATNLLLESFSVPVAYLDIEGNISTSEYQIFLSIAKPSIQELGGNSPQGRHYEKNMGISFIRAGREIGFGTYGFTTSSEPRNRWWGMEIRFNPELDELFGVTNNKQEVTNIKALTDSMKQDLFEDEITLEEKFIVDLNKFISERLKQMMTTVRGRREGTKARSKNKDPVKEIVNNELNKQTKVQTESKIHSSKLSDDEKIKERVSALLADNSLLTEEGATKIAIETINYEVDIMTDEWSGTAFLDKKMVGNAAMGKVNREHPFYDMFWKELEDAEDPRGFNALSIILMALIRAEDEMQVTMDSKNLKTLGRFREKWGYYIDLLLDKAVD